jgi:hypothetical protein
MAAQNATTAQIAGALDDLYAAAADVPDLGAVVKNGSTSFSGLGADRPGRVRGADDATGQLGPEPHQHRSHGARRRHRRLEPGQAGNLQGTHYRYQVQVFVRAGLVRNLVTDPYALGLTLGSSRASSWTSVAADQAARLGPGAPPATVAAPTDLHLRAACARLLHQRHQRARRPARQVPGLHREPVQRHEAPRGAGRPG